jgi:hypothetical protein
VSGLEEGRAVRDNGHDLKKNLAERELRLRQEQRGRSEFITGNSWLRIPI